MLAMLTIFTCEQHLIIILIIIEGGEECLGRRSVYFATTQNLSRIRKERAHPQLQENYTGVETARLWN